jgi:hypothetical protein
MRVWSLIAASSVVLMSAGAVSAQSLIQSPEFAAPDIYGRGKNIGVLERERPDYDAVGIHAGGFTIYPKLDVETDYIDNVFAAATGEKSDVTFSINPVITAQSNWGRHSLSLQASVDQTEFSHYASEDTTAWYVRADGRIDVHGQSYINFGADVQHQYEPRGNAVSIGNTAHPVSYDTEGLYVRGVYGEDRIRASFDGAFRNIAYDNVAVLTQVPGGVFAGIAQESLRNLYSYGGAGRIDYALTPDEAVFAKVTVTSSDYLHGTMNVSAATDRRDAVEVQALTGATFDITALTRGEVGVGYVDHDYQSRFYRALSGFSLAAKVDYFPSQLVTLSMVAARQVRDAAFSNASGFFANTIAVEADYELRRNIIVSAATGYEYDQFAGINRNDNVWNLQGQARYFLTRNIGIGATLSYADRQSTGAVATIGPKFTETRAGLSLVFQR